MHNLRKPILLLPALQALILRRFYYIYKRSDRMFHADNSLLHYHDPFEFPPFSHIQQMARKIIRQNVVFGLGLNWNIVR